MSCKGTIGANEVVITVWVDMAAPQVPKARSVTFAGVGPRRTSYLPVTLLLSENVMANPRVGPEITIALQFAEQADGTGFGARVGDPVAKTVGAKTLGIRTRIRMENIRGLCKNPRYPSNLHCEPGCI